MLKTVLIMQIVFAMWCSAHPRSNGNIPVVRVIGGTEMNIKDVPWQVSLQSRGYHFCGGSIISTNWILTAAHCVTWTSKITVRVGSGNNGDGGSIIDVKRIIIHESYKRLYVVDYDFALLELKEPLEFDESVKPITLPVEQIKDEVRCLVTGWGRTQSEDYLSPSKLQGVELPVVNEKVCKQKYKKHPIIDFSPYITERVMCAGGEDPIKSGCHGDSGGPLTCRDTEDGERKLYGVVSWGNVNCEKPDEFPNVYARVVSVREWIQNNTGI